MRSVPESEVKFAADDVLVLPDLRDLVARTVRLPDQHLHATYYDTSDLRLWHRGITLRHRRENEGEEGVWTVKVPSRRRGPALDRSEHSWTGPGDSIPGGVDLMLSGIVRRSPLTHIATMETRRRRLVLLDDGDERLGELDDDSVKIQGGSHDGRQFRQIEFELASAPPATVDAVVDRLRRAGARTGRTGPKLAEALDVAGLDRTDGPTGRKASMGSFVGQVIASALGQILDHDLMLRIDPVSPSAADIHKMRVAVRRLRSDLKTLAPVLDPVWTRHVRTDLRWIGSMLGNVRDADVLASHLWEYRSGGVVDDSGVTRLSDASDEERRTALVQLRGVLSSDRYLLLLDKLHAASSTVPFRSSEEASRKAKSALPELLGRPWKRLQREVRHAGHRPSDQALHEIRKRAKQVRYAAEMAAQAQKRGALPLAHPSKRLQTVLGRHQDAVVADQWLRRQARRDPVGVAFAAGQLSSIQDRRRRRARSKWKGAWKAVRSAKPN